MKLARLTVCGFLGALAACSDMPAAPKELSAKPDFSKITMMTPSELAAHGIDRSIFPEPRKPSRGVARSIEICERDNPESCLPSGPPSVAHVDYFNSIDTITYYGQKLLHFSVFAQAHDNMESTVLDVSYYASTGCQGPWSLFYSTHQVAYGSPAELTDELYLSYDTSQTYGWLTYAAITYTANPGSVVDGVFLPSITYPAADEKCF